MPSPIQHDGASAPQPLTYLTYTVADLSRLLQCSVRHVHRMRAAARIPGVVHIGDRLVRFSRPVIDAWLAAGAK